MPRPISLRSCARVVIGPPLAVVGLHYVSICMDEVRPRGCEDLDDLPGRHVRAPIWLRPDAGYSRDKVYQIVARLVSAGWLDRLDNPDATPESGGLPGITYRLRPAAVPMARRMVTDAQKDVAAVTAPPRTRRRIAAGGGRDAYDSRGIFAAICASLLLAEACADRRPPEGDGSAGCPGDCPPPCAMITLSTGKATCLSH